MTLRRAQSGIASHLTPVIATPECGGLPNLVGECPPGAITVAPTGAAASTLTRGAAGLRSFGWLRLNHEDTNS